MALRVGVCGCRIFSSKLFTPSIVNIRGIKKYVSLTLKELRKRNNKFKAETDPKKLLEISKRSNFIEWNQEAEVYAFGKRLQEDFRLDLLSQAFVDRSYLAHLKKKFEELELEVHEPDIQVNDSLAELGEKIISNHVWDYVSHFLPRFPLEGIESIHQYLTSEENLSYISKNLGTTQIILSDDYPVENATYSKTLKAIVGALHESQGIERTNLFVRDFIITQLSGKDVNDFLPIDNYFDVLRNILEREGKELPEPRIICRSAINTILANYHVGIYSNKQLIGHCSGESIEIAVEMASLDALKRLFHTTDDAKPMRYDVVLPDIGQPQRNLSLNEWSSLKLENQNS